MPKLLIVLVLSAIILVASFSVLTGLVDTPFIRTKYGKLEGFNDVVPAYQQSQAVLFEDKLDNVINSNVLEDGADITIAAADEVVFTQEEINSFLNLKVVPKVSLKELTKSLPESLKAVILPVMSVTDFKISDVNVAFMEGYLVVSGHVGGEGRVPFYTVFTIQKYSDYRVRVNITKASLGLIDIKGGALNSLNENVNSRIEKQMVLLEKYRIDEIQVVKGSLKYKGVFPAGLINL
ncbi:MAG: hypothetical protein UU77_C0070G0005 [candidate division WWE3 bacterium GW2011_GWC1_41_7]|uniref:Uncharacterized protein n=4 Tax=Katanobacteria TaxID=422282 RepID=A0A0G0X6I3_UNCKA|nr:MAG: hypothetical protein UU72_C0006G0004 [candidate division WWE3 bacterium GW2011_GWB1_41_6]KKS18700.1 MAG: hypothetical protein UU77_C0070G0005 [candidate division WWE3 bacterium GW2011_GWC1_41_7]KKS20659.1 MAG: hypothetical protein UU80_C0047G0005 [candidate division WWE3 bacterium GW2011_GWA1_41_8]OGC57093.1 MAG: hypothetical protein A2976_01860 [candidate division WWE3 bacterium RIFCSPLOWO2_01_FULL_41_9]